MRFGEEGAPTMVEEAKEGFATKEGHHFQEGRCEEGEGRIDIQGVGLLGMPTIGAHAVCFPLGEEEP